MSRLLHQFQELRQEELPNSKNLVWMQQQRFHHQEDHQE
jgi:hypothetical protein